MARRKKRTTRRRFTGINLLTAAEALVGANIVTQGLFNTDPIAFLIGKTSAGYGQRNLSVSNIGGVRIGIGELFGLGGANVQNQWDAVKTNVENNWVDMAVKTVVTGIGFKFGKKLLAKPRREINKGFKMLGLGTTVRV
jgi:hypothetical protein